MKEHYQEKPLEPRMDPDRDDPFELFDRWMRKASTCGLRDPGAMALATASPDGRPSVRMMLLKGVDRQGFVFYTNLSSRKARELEATKCAALCFHWMPIGRQVRVEGIVESVTEKEADEYFASRPRLSKLGAWASRQSEAMEGYFELEQKVCATAARFGLGEIPRPPFWSGFRLVPDSIEFWREKPFRRHERIVYSRNGLSWTKQWLFP